MTMGEKQFKERVTLGKDHDVKKGGDLDEVYSQQPFRLIYLQNERYKDGQKIIKPKSC